MAYSEQVLEHYKNPKNVGSMDETLPDVGTALVGEPACGDVLRLQVRIRDGRIVEAVFKAFGCGSAIASSSLATEWLQGKTLPEALQLTNQYIAETLSLPPIKNHCSVLAQEAVKRALQNWQKKQSDMNLVINS